MYISANWITQILSDMWLVIVIKTFVRNEEFMKYERESPGRCEVVKEIWEGVFSPPAPHPRPSLMTEEVPLCVCPHLLNSSSASSLIAP